MKLANLRKNFYCLFFLLMTIGCENPDKIIVNSEQESSENRTMTPSLSFLMPDSLPEIITEKALKVALKNGYSDYRILQVEDESKNKFNITYYSDENFHIILSMNFDVDLINYSIKDSLDVTHLLNSRLYKSATTSCWDLASMSKESPYNATYTAQFGQSATTYGWFSKIIYDLRLDQQQCIGSWFLGSWGFNDEISSHRWRDDLGNLSSVGMIARPYRLSVYQNTNAQGTRKRWTASGYSSNYLYPTVSIDIVNYSSWNYDGTSTCIDNDVTSILFEYRVFTPIIN